MPGARGFKGGVWFGKCFKDAEIVVWLIRGNGVVMRTDAVMLEVGKGGKFGLGCVVWFEGDFVRCDNALFSNVIVRNYKFVQEMSGNVFTRCASLRSMSKSVLQPQPSNMAASTLEVDGIYSPDISLRFAQSKCGPHWNHTMFFRIHSYSLTTSPLQAQTCFHVHRPALLPTHPPFPTPTYTPRR